MPIRDASTGLKISSFRINSNSIPISKSSLIASPLAPSTYSPYITMDSNQNQNSYESGGRIPLATDPSGVYSITMSDSDMALTKKKFVKVSSVGEVEVCPDRVEFCVRIACTKTDVASARESVRKREEFLMLALKKVGVLSNSISVTSLVKKFKLGDEEADDNDDEVLERKILRNAEKNVIANDKARGKSTNNLAGDPVMDVERTQVIKELYVVSDSLHKYMELFSIVNEKLDRQVNVSPPVIRISPEYLQIKTQEAAKLAMNNAIEKAKQLLQTQKILKATVGKLFYSVEESLLITDISEYQNISTNTTFESLKWKRNNKLIVCNLTSLFEVNTTKAKGYLKLV